MKAISIFLAVFFAIALSVLLFAPERLPTGIGISPTPIEAAQRSSFLGQGQVAILRNPTVKTLHNVLIVLQDKSGNIMKTEQHETWEPGVEKQHGWLEGWEIDSDTRVRISASGYYPQIWKY